MSTTAISILMGLFFVLTAQADEVTKISLKNGNTLTWGTYYEQDNQYCTQKSFGTFCIEKGAVASIETEDDNPTGATVIYNKISPEEKMRAEMDYKESKQRQQDYLRDQECRQLQSQINSVVTGAKLNNAYGSLVNVVLLQNKYKAKCLTASQAKEMTDRQQKILGDYQQDFKDRQRDQKVDDIHRKMYGW